MLFMVGFSFCWGAEENSQPRSFPSSKCLGTGCPKYPRQLKEVPPELSMYQLKLSERNRELRAAKDEYLAKLKLFCQMLKRHEMELEVEPEILFESQKAVISTEAARNDLKKEFQIHGCIALIP